MDDLIRRLNKLKNDNYTGTVTLSFYKGNISKKIKLEVTEVMNKSQKLNLDKAKKDINAYRWGSYF